MQKTNKGLVILTVEDNPSDLFLLEHMLRSSGLEIGQLFSTDLISEAYSILREQEIHLVLLDLTLPDSFGIQSFLRLKTAVQKIPVIILTTSADERDIQVCYQTGANTYVQKPVSFDGLIEAIRRLKAYWFEIALLPKETGYE